MGNKQLFLKLQIVAANPSLSDVIDRISHWNLFIFDYSR
jgi:hypothetical protein